MVRMKLLDGCSRDPTKEPKAFANALLPAPLAPDDGETVLCLKMTQEPPDVERLRHNHYIQLEPEGEKDRKKSETCLKPTQLTLASQNALVRVRLDPWWQCALLSKPVCLKGGTKFAKRAWALTICMWRGCQSLAPSLVSTAVAVASVGVAVAAASVGVAVLASVAVEEAATASV